jgi:transposase-like protein
MDDYTQQDGAARYAALETLAAEFFESTRWKSAFCRRYGLTPQSVTAWRHNGAPAWAPQAMADAVKAKLFDEIAAMLRFHV